jgi:hypothetical protein
MIKLIERFKDYVSTIRKWICGRIYFKVRIEDNYYKKISKIKNG